LPFAQEPGLRRRGTRLYLFAKHRVREGDFIFRSLLDPSVLSLVPLAPYLFSPESFLPPMSEGVLVVFYDTHSMGKAKRQAKDLLPDLRQWQLKPPHSILEANK